MEINQEKIEERFSQLVYKFAKGNNSKFAESIGFSSTAVNNVVNGKNIPGFKMISAIFEVYPNVNRDWLVSGKGEMFFKGDLGPAHPKLSSSVQIEENISNSTPVLWETLKEQYEKRIKDLEFIVYLYKQEKGVNANFNFVSKESPVYGELKVIRGDKKPAEESVQIA